MCQKVQKEEHKRAAMNINAQVQLEMMHTMAKNCELHDFIP
jgi:hypothetical protein